ncbi:MAG: DUF1697 domain-containing protein [Nocardioides sp.]|uniref:DUF1697 domain-containing protein n=1 Tax=Nocardioides sp. TaxID=35761 RepID=UPI0039E5B191
MTSYVALIRGIGPGDPRKSNESLRGVLEGLGLDRVRSVLASGNVVFESGSRSPAKLADRIEAAWPEELGFSALTVVRSRAQIAALLDAEPFGDAAHGKASYQLVTFFRTALRSAPTPPEGLAGVEVVGIVDGALCTIHDTTLTGGPEVMKWIDQTYEKQTTSRTPLTLRKILAKMDA